MDYPSEPPKRPPLAEEPDEPEASADPIAENMVWLPPVTEARPSPPRRTGQGSVLGAAMLAVGDILEPEKTKVEIQQENDDPEPDLPFTLDFGDLPPLN